MSQCQVSNQGGTDGVSGLRLPPPNLVVAVSAVCYFIKLSYRGDDLAGEIHLKSCQSVKARQDPATGNAQRKTETERRPEVFEYGERMRDGV